MKLSQKDIESLSEICSAHDIKLAYIFGSTVTGKVHAESDLDLAIAFSPEISIQQQRKEEILLYSALQSIVRGVEIDIVNLNTLKNPLLLYKIVFSSLLILSKDARLKIRLERTAMQEYEDTKHLRHYQLQLMLERIRTKRFANFVPTSNYLKKYVAD